jgi:hypothetical protein
MLRRLLIFAAIAVYFGVFACCLWPTRQTVSPSASYGSQTTASASHSVAGLPYRSIGIQIQRMDWMDQYKKSIDEIAAVGADTVLLVVDARQENGQSSHIYLDMRTTPTPDQLKDLIGHARDRHLRVILMPIVLLDNPIGDEWRGTLAPRSWDDWFDSYRDMMNQFAWISEAYGVDMLVVGSELVSSEKYDDQWTRTIQSIRKVYKGRLTYSSNWDHYTSVPFWDQLDVIGMNSYWKLGNDRNVTVPEIKMRWLKIQEDLHRFIQKEHKPLMFLEVGWCSLANAAHEPWDYTQVTEPIDLDLQKRLYEGFFQSWYGTPWLGGFSIWEWPPGDGGPNDRGYTPENKPAEGVLKSWLAKPKWDVQP